MIRLALSTTGRIHAMRDEGHVYERETLCGRSCLGWATEEWNPFRVQCAQCRRALDESLSPGLATDDTNQ